MSCRRCSCYVSCSFWMVRFAFGVKIAWSDLLTRSFLHVHLRATPFVIQSLIFFCTTETSGGHKDCGCSDGWQNSTRDRPWRSRRLLPVGLRQQKSLCVSCVFSRTTQDLYRNTRSKISTCMCQVYFPALHRNSAVKHVASGSKTEVLPGSYQCQ